jgi:RNA polymerase sigma-70 factor (sigma-E family)
VTTAMDLPSDAPAPAALSADDALTLLFRAHYAGLVRLALVLADDHASAEDVVQDAFAKMHRSWGRLRDPDRALSYLRAAVVNGGRSRLRRLRVARAYVPPHPLDAASAEERAVDREDTTEVLAALRRLPTRQREVLVLRYYADLSEAEIATTLGLSTGAVKSHAHRGLAALTRALEETR